MYKTPRAPGMQSNCRVTPARTFSPAPSYHLVVQHRGEKGHVGNALHQSEPVQAQIKEALGRARPPAAMSQLANWTLGLAVDSQRARNLIHPQAADSPVVLASLVVFTAALTAWMRWDTVPTAGICPTLDLYVKVLERTAVMTLGAMVLPDQAFLDRPLETSPGGLAMEMETLRGELQALVSPMVEWRRGVPGHIGSGMDRVTIALLQACEELSYFEGFPVLRVIAESVERINSTMTDLHLRVSPWTPNPRVLVTPSGGSDGAPMTTLSVYRMNEAYSRLQSEAMRDQDGEEGRGR